MSTDNERYRQRLFELRSRLLAQIERIGEAIHQDVEAPGDVSRLPTHAADRDSERLDVDVTVEQTETELLESVNDALNRIELGTFGRCEDCGRAIAKSRLDAMPYTPYCINCARQHESR